MFMDNYDWGTTRDITHDIKVEPIGAAFHPFDIPHYDGPHYDGSVMIEPEIIQLGPVLGGILGIIHELDR